MTFDPRALKRRLGPPQRITLKTLADGEAEGVALEGWQLGHGEAADPEDTHIKIPAVTRVDIYATVDGDFVGFIDERPRADQPLAERWAKQYPEGYWQAVRDSLDDLATWLYEKAWHKDAVTMALAKAKEQLPPT